MKRYISFIAIISLLFAFLQMPVIADAQSAAPYKVIMSGSNVVLVGKTTQLKASVMPEEADQKVTWESDDPSIASVDSKGNVKGKKNGYVFIVARSAVDFRIWECILMTVTDVAVKEIEIGGVTEKLSTDRIVTLTAMVRPYGAANAVEWKSSDHKVATIDEYGTLTTKKPGTVKITATALDGSKTSKTVTIQVVKAQFKSADEKAEWVVNTTIRSGMSEREKAKTLHDWLINHSYYDHTRTRHSAQDILLDGLGVCESYAKAYQMLLTKAKIRNIYIIGTAGGESHAWNLVRVDNQWYHVDTTWDDPGSSTNPKSGQEYSKYFLVSDAMIKSDHQWDSSISADRNKVGSYTWTIDGSTYSLDTNTKTAELLNADNKKEEVIIPETVKDGAAFKVTSIGYSAFYNCTKLKSVKIKAKLTQLKEGAFNSQQKLAKISLPQTITEIGGSAFSQCTALKNITIPKKVISIQRRTFYECKGMTKVEIPKGVTTIGEEAFANCSGLKKVTIPKTVKSIESAAFYGCSNLKSITLPDNITNIAGNAFNNCPAVIYANPESKTAKALEGAWISYSPK